MMWRYAPLLYGGGPKFASVCGRGAGSVGMRGHRNVDDVEVRAADAGRRGGRWGMGCG
jgi:hypothetical protein